MPLNNPSSGGGGGGVDQSVLDAKAPLASPTFTGTPTAPTASGGTNSVQLATTAFVKAAIDALINGAPGALDTLKEISDQLAADESAVSALTTTVAGKVPSTRTVAGKALTADVSLAKGDVGLGNADNTSDLNKPISTAQAAVNAVKVGSTTITTIVSLTQSAYTAIVTKDSATLYVIVG